MGAGNSRSNTVDASQLLANVILDTIQFDLKQYSSEVPKAAGEGRVRLL